MEKKKSVKAGKWIVIALVGAILFFLILPFLDGSATTPAAQRADGKATPQIFTSNPLRRLAEKIMAAFSRKNQNPSTFDNDALFENEEAVTLASAKRASTDVQDPSAAAAAPDSVEEEPDDFDPSRIDEKGEWILVNQTDPITGIRGMHDIKSSDSAYDRLVRLERQAKYTQSVGALAPKQPVSKWARLWNPVKKFFGFDDAPEVVATRQLGGKALSTEHPRYPSKANRASLDMQGLGKQTLSNRRRSQQAALAMLTIDPEQSLEKTAENLLKNAKKTLNKKDFNEYQKLLMAERNRLRKEMRNAVLNEISQDARKEQNIDDTVGQRLLIAAGKKDAQNALQIPIECASGKTLSSAFYAPRSQEGCHKPTRSSKYKHDEKKLEQTKEESRGILESTVDKLKGIVKTDKLQRLENNIQDPVAVTVVLDVYPAGKNPFIADINENPNTNGSQAQASEEEMEQTFDEQVREQYLNFLFEKSGCQNSPCALVASSDYAGTDLEDTLTGGFMKLVTLESPNNDQEFIERMKNNGQFDESQMQQLTEDYLKKIKPAYSSQPLDKLSGLAKDHVKIISRSATAADKIATSGVYPAMWLAYPKTATKPEVEQETPAEENGTKELSSEEFFQQGISMEDQSTGMTKLYGNNSSRNYTIAANNDSRLKEVDLKFNAKKAMTAGQKSSTSLQDALKP